MQKNNYINLPNILIFGHKQFSQLVSSVLPEFASRATFKVVDAIIGTIEEANGYIEKYQPDIVISAGSNASYLQSSLDIPVLSLPVTDADVLSAIHKASFVAKTIHLITFDNYSRLVNLLQETTNLKVVHHTYQTADQARQQYHLADIHANDALVGASLLCGLATQDHYKAFLIYSTESCRSLLQKAVETAQEEQAKLHKSVLYSWLFNASKVPLIAVDKNTDQLHYNNAAKDEFAINVGLKHSIIADLYQQDCALYEDGECTINQQAWWFHKDSVAMKQHHFDVFQFYRQQPDIKTRQVEYSGPSAELVFSSSQMRELLKQTSLFAGSPSPVLITGESGVGKELVAKQLHLSSSRANHNFIAINCAAIPHELFEGELFGYVDGAFTGSRRGGSKGLLHAANQGTLFLDEIAEMPLSLQVKLLRVLQEQSYRPVGSHKEIKFDVKIVAATNRSLKELVLKKQFREDLYYRLNVLNLFVPALRHRKDDIKLLAQAKLAENSRVHRISNSRLNACIEAMLPSLKAYAWPGNIRELENIMQRIALGLSSTTENSVDDVMGIVQNLAPELLMASGVTDSGAIKDHELKLVSDAMVRFNNNKEQVSEYLGISQTTLWRRLKQLG